ncbi:MAG: S-methyl-5-thioribose-1-phosphate isomerase [Proteobacteria bacterium]|nr:S-methyl-5-thioribose-1-phosphate isomerase [Pseudomonadota bacterium]HQR04356.1 S-methyl-5-thioribose-1-phosphate isomerase [Rhodocyclaceae bacterium]
MGESPATLAEDGRSVLVLDQTLLPDQVRLHRLTTLEDAAEAIRTMRVRGAPLIGATAAYGIALAALADASDRGLEHAASTLGATRPTAVNLHWALERMLRTLHPLPPTDRVDHAWHEARAIAREDGIANARIGQFGLSLLQALEGHRPLQIMTHCNAGRLATVAHGTALAPIYAAHAAGLESHVWVSETRPRNQGLLTAWELGQAGIGHTLITDNAAGLLLMRGDVDAVIVGADRIAANGDVANKVGTYLKALAASAHGVPFYVAAPLSTVDFFCPSGSAIPVEERNAAELGAGNTPAANPAFDITPAHLVTAIITERGVVTPAELERLR